MKSFKFYFAIVVLSLIFSGPVSSQSLVVKDHVWHLDTGFKTYDSYDAHGVYTPFGNINLRINFQLDMRDPLVLIAVEEGPITFGLDITTGGIVVPCMVTVFPNGRLKVNGHL